MHFWFVAIAAVAIVAMGVCLVFFRPIGVLLCAIGVCGLGLTYISMDRSTFPSSARRITVVGRAVDWSRHSTRRHHWWTFVLMMSPSDRLLLRTGIDLPKDGADIALANGDMIRVTYLDERFFGNDPRAIRIDIVSGRFAGWGGSMDANWLGWWIGVPFGLAISAVAFGAAQQWKRNQAESDESGATSECSAS